MDEELNKFAEANQATRETMVQNITKLRDESELLSGETREKKQKEMKDEILALQQYDKESRQILLEGKDKLLGEVMEDIQKVVSAKGTEGGYDYILDSRNIMYAAEKYDLTSEVVEELNKE